MGNWKVINLVIVFHCISVFQVFAEAGPIIYFPSDEFDARLISDEKGTYHFWYKNIGDQPLIVANAKGNESWLVAQPNNYEPTAPGEWNFIAVTYFNINCAKGQVCKKEGTVRLTTNANNNAGISLRVRLNIHPKKNIVRSFLDNENNTRVDSIIAPLAIIYSGVKDDFYVTVKNPFPNDELIVDNLVRLDETESPLRIQMNPQRNIIPVYGGVDCRFGLIKSGQHKPGLYANQWKLTFRDRAYHVIITTNVLIKNGLSQLEVHPIEIDTVDRGVPISINVTIRNTGDSGVELNLPSYYPGSQEMIRMRGLTTTAEFPIYLPANDSIRLPFELNTDGINGSYSRTVKLRTSQPIKRSDITLSFKGFAFCETCPEIVFDSLSMTRNVEYAGDGMFEFWFTNTGDEPLIISRVRTNDGGSMATCSKKPIPPGGREKVIVRYNTKRRGPFRRSISVQSNAYLNATVSLVIKGVVSPKTEPFVD